MNIICKITGYFCPEEKTDPETEIKNKQEKIRKEQEQARRIAEQKELKEQEQAQKIAEQKELEAKWDVVKRSFKLIKNGKGEYDSETRTHTVSAEWTETKWFTDTEDFDHFVYWEIPRHTFTIVNCATGNIDLSEYDTTNKNKLPENLQELYGKICRTE